MAWSLCQKPGKTVTANLKALAVVPFLSKTTAVPKAAYDKPGDIMSKVFIDGIEIELPPGPKCIRCGHEPCPICREWCDVIGDENDPCPCEETFQCVYADQNELNAWSAECDTIIKNMHKVN